MALSISELTSLGQEVIDALNAGDSQKVLELVETYVDSFDEWKLKAPQEGKSELEALFKIHSEIVKRVTDVRSGVSKQLQTLKERGRGLRAYIDPLPKQISVRKGQKG